VFQLPWACSFFQVSLQAQEHDLILEKIAHVREGRLLANGKFQGEAPAALVV
jgi:hypothetical protein